MKYLDEKIILVEYFDDAPHYVMTDNGCYDFDTHASGWLMFTQSLWGCHLSKNILYDTNLSHSEKNNFKLWVDPEYTISIKYPDGIQVIKDPIELSQYMGNGVSSNPFDVGEEVEEIYYCEKCKAYYSETGCIEHSGTDEEKGE